MKGFLAFENNSSRFDYSHLLLNAIDQAIQEDVGNGDLTSEALISQASQAMGSLLVKEDCILGGLEAAKIICHRLDANLDLTSTCRDGEYIAKGTSVGTISGATNSLLKAERLVLNVMQRMSGIATKTKKFVDQAHPFGVVILDTRKTTPNFRIFEKWAVAIGGGKNHRYALYDQILIKDNHIKIAQGIRQALDQVTNYLQENGLDVPVIVEVQDEEEFSIAIHYPMITRILMDNFKPDEILNLTQKYQFTQKLEASGGINLANMDSYLQSGIHYLSIGDLTHHVQSVDISLKIQ
ncbi:MAG: carboxylating nicotinate-nucleotide diphosphorylase [Algoriphagus sp.]|nr:carboxylating nicotinate-nucleotide diphosphorylase [Algoriphagus sp.]